MKFSDIERSEWPSLQPYLDTAVLPLSGLAGTEGPCDATAALERLRDALDPIETALRGRIVIFPALHYMAEEDELAAFADRLCGRFREAGFRFCVVVAGPEGLASALRIPAASAVIGPGPGEPASAYRAKARSAVEAVWRAAGSGAPTGQM